MKHLDNLVYLLNEEFNDSSAIVYHRSRSGENLWDDLINGKQFVPGNGDYYGNGCYTTYDLESQLSDSMKRGYGKYILKLKVKGLQNFFIFDSDIYKNVNHKDPKNMFEEQINRFNIRTKRGEKITDASSFICYYQNESAKPFHDYTNIQDRCNGIIYSGGWHDGNVLVVYPQFIKGIIPLGISSDDGKTWKKIDSSDEAQKVSYMSASKNMNLTQKKYEQTKDGDYIIRKIESRNDTDRYIPSSYYEKISKDSPVFKITNIKISNYFYFQKDNDNDDFERRCLPIFSYKTLKFMNIGFLKSGGYSAFKTPNKTYFGKRIPDLNGLHRALVISIDHIGDVIKKGSYEKSYKENRELWGIIYSSDGKTYYDRDEIYDGYFDDNGRLNSEYHKKRSRTGYNNHYFYHLVSSTDGSCYHFVVNKTQYDIKYSLDNDSEELITADPKEIISFMKKNNLKLDKYFYGSHNIDNLMHYRRDIAEILDKADLHNNARGKLVENYFGY